MTPFPVELPCLNSKFDSSPALNDRGYVWSSLLKLYTSYLLKCKEIDFVFGMNNPLMMPVQMATSPKTLTIN